MLVSFCINKFLFVFISATRIDHKVEIMKKINCYICGVTSVFLNKAVKTGGWRKLYNKFS
jgi:hypothetical protein